MIGMGLGLMLGGNNAVSGGAPVLLDGSEADGTNIVNQSFVAGWNNIGFGATLALNTTLAPDGTTTAATMTEDTATSRHIVFVQGIITGSYTQSLYLKQGTQRYVQLFYQKSDASNAVYAYIDLQTGTVSDSGIIGSGSLTSATIQAAVNGFYKLTIVGNNGQTLDNGYFIIAMSDRSTQGGGSLDNNNPSYLGAAKTVFIWRPKLVD